jgi:HK97 family phage major capsid protein
MSTEIHKPKKINRFVSIPEFDRKIDIDKREITFPVSSELAIDDYAGDNLILEHSEGAVIMDRIRSAAPLLFNHNRDQHLGKIVNAELSEGKLLVTARFGNSELAREKFQDVQDGILSEVSVSARMLEVKLDQSASDGGDTYRATKWEPLEASLVTVPADITVGIGRAENEKADDNLIIKKETKMSDTENKEVAREVAEKPREVITFKTDPKEIERAAKAEQERVSSIHELAGKYAVEKSVVREYVEGQKPLQDFQHFILTERMGAKPVPANQSTEIGMSEKEKNQYSLVRALRLQANHMPLDGLEKEASEAMAKKLKREAQGFFIPTDMTTHDRTLTANVASAGGYTVATDVLGSSLIELLRNKTMVAQLGARSLSGLQGNVAIPKVSGGATAYWLGETEAVTASDQTFEQVALTPKRLAGLTKYSKQLLAQSSISVESFVREDLMRVLAIAKDLAAINGSGVAGEPLGILNTTGIGTVTFGATATRAKAIEFQTDVAGSNAYQGSLAYLTNSTVAGAWMGIDESTSTAQWLWKGNINDGLVVGQRAVSSNQVPDNKVIFGNWADALMADWDGMDVVVDPYTSKGSGLIEISIQLMTDFAVRHPESFSASTDAGNQ